MYKITSLPCLIYFPTSKHRKTLLPLYHMIKSTLYPLSKNSKLTFNTVLEHFAKFIEDSSIFKFILSFCCIKLILKYRLMFQCKLLKHLLSCFRPLTEIKLLDFIHNRFNNLLVFRLIVYQVNRICHLMLNTFKSNFVIN